jgi:predicted Kef-type K+ transport protein
LVILIAGIIIGPASPGFVADVNIASQLSEIGIMLLMFGVGLHFSPADLLAVKRLAVPVPSCRWDVPLYSVSGLPRGGAGHLVRRWYSVCPYPVPAR